MPSYDDWNTALHEHFLGGAATGTTIYLDVSKESLERIGRFAFSELEVDDWSGDFLQAVKGRVVRDGRVVLVGLRKRGSTRLDSLPFLAAMVLVASQMEGSNEIHELNYFLRLRRALDVEPVSKQNSRPRGMDSGSSDEEPLWLSWGQMLKEQGLLPTARPGEGARRYVQYPISQTLFRSADRNRLYEFFMREHFDLDIDEDTVVGRIRAHGLWTTQIQSLLQRTGSDAIEVHSALYSIYGDWLDTRTEGGSGTGRLNLRSTLRCGLYRGLKFRSDEPFYQLFPQQPKGGSPTMLGVIVSGEQYALTVDRPGYFSPVGPYLTSEQLEGGADFPVEGHPHINRLALPKRKAWALKVDPFATGAAASLGRPRVGEHFTLLVHVSLIEDVERAVEQGLLKSRPRQELGAPLVGWHEYPEMLVVANQFAEASDISSELRTAVRPTGVLSLSTHGGLSLPDRAGWLVSAPPIVELHSYFSEVKVSVLHGDQLLQELEVRVDPTEPTVVPVEWAGPGEYELAATTRKQPYPDRKLINLLAWEELPEPVEAHLGTEVLRLTDDIQFRGARPEVEVA